MYKFPYTFKDDFGICKIMDGIMASFATEIYSVVSIRVQPSLLIPIFITVVMANHVLYSWGMNSS
jgi:hypothetical protein